MFLLHHPEDDYDRFVCPYLLCSDASLSVTSSLKELQNRWWKNWPYSR